MRSRSLIESWEKIFESIRSHPITFLLLVIAVVCTFAGFFWVVNFIAADTPAEALSKWGKRLPAGWEAGVMSHGEYFEWYTISGHPGMFAGAVCWLAGSVALVGYLHKRLQGAPAA